MERLERDRITKRVYVGECAGSRSVGRPRKRWIDIVKDCLDIREARRTVQDKSEWREYMGRSRGMNPKQLFETCGLKSVRGRAYLLKGIKGKNYFSFFS